MSEIPQLNLSVKEAARVLGVSPRLMRTLISKGEVPVLRVADRVLVPIEALREWNRAHTTVPS